MQVGCLPQSLDVVRSVRSSREIRQVKLDLVPSLVESHGHGADEGLYTGGTLVVRSSESSAHALVVKDLHFEGEIFLQLFARNTVVSHCGAALTFLIIMTRKGSLIARVFWASTGQVM